MAVFTVSPITKPGQALGTGDDWALHIEQFTGIVEGTIARKSKISPYVDVRPVRGTSMLTNEGIGESTLQVLTKGESPSPTINEANRIILTVDTTIISRNWVAQLDDFQKHYDFKSRLGEEQGKKIAKFTDQAFAIQAAKSAAASGSAYGTLDGHFGGTTKTLGATGDATDPAALYSAFGDLFAEMEEKDVDPQGDGVIAVVGPKQFAALSDAEQIVNGEYVTAQGVTMQNVKMLKAWGVPIISTNNQPKTNITAHELSNARNGNAFNGDFTKLVATAFAPNSLLAGETIPLMTNVWWDDATKGYFIDSWLAFSATPNRNEYSGRIVLP